MEPEPTGALGRDHMSSVKPLGIKDHNQNRFPGNQTPSSLPSPNPASETPGLDEDLFSRILQSHPNGSLHAPLPPELLLALEGSLPWPPGLLGPGRSNLGLR